MRVASLVQQIEDGYNEGGPDGLTLVEERDRIIRETHEFVDDQYDCWNGHLRPRLAEHGIRGARFARTGCEAASLLSKSTAKGNSILC